MARRPGLSVRARLTLSYAGFLMLAAFLLLAVVWVFLLRYVPDGQIIGPEDGRPWPHTPNRTDLVNAFAPKAAMMLGVVLVLGLVGGWWLAGRMLAPLNRITDATRRAGAGALGHRIHLEGRQDEFRELADAFDTMLGQIEAQVAEQQRFAANASHELRTPLAVTQTLLEVARTDPGHDDGELVERLYAVNQRAIDLTEALLLLSKADRRAFVRTPVDLSLLAEEAAETLLPLAEKRGTTVEVTGDPVTAAGSPALLLQLTTNLVHNAIVHNLPEGGRVEVATAARPGGAVLTVANTGPALSPELVGTLVEPFQRGTGRIRTDHSGVGLGLAIVRSIAEAHDGELALAPRPGGGLQVTVRLPG